VEELGICSGGARARGKEEDARLPAWSPWRQIIKHVACNEVAKVGHHLGRFWANLVHGPKTKFVVPLMIYKFH
jgi:hypothetical protein